MNILLLQNLADHTAEYFTKTFYLRFKGLGPVIMYISNNKCQEVGKKIHYNLNRVLQYILTTGVTRQWDIFLHVTVTEPRSHVFLYISMDGFTCMSNIYKLHSHTEALHTKTLHVCLMMLLDYSFWL